MLGEEDQAARAPEPAEMRSAVEELLAALEMDPAAVKLGNTQVRRSRAKKKWSDFCGEGLWRHRGELFLSFRKFFPSDSFSTPADRKLMAGGTFLALMKKLQQGERRNFFLRYQGRDNKT